MKKVYASSLCILASLSVGYAQVAYSYDPVSGELSSGSTVFGTLNFNDLDIVADFSQITNVTTGQFSFAPNLGNSNDGTTVIISYSLNITNPDFSLIQSSAIFGSGGLTDTTAPFTNAVIGATSSGRGTFTVDSGSGVITDTGILSLPNYSNSIAGGSVLTVADPTSFGSNDISRYGSDPTGSTFGELYTIAGTDTVTFTNTSTTNVNQGINLEHISLQLEFSQIPEPSAVALLGLGGLVLLARRRRD